MTTTRTVTVSIPSMLRHETGGQASVLVSTGSVRTILARLNRDVPGLYRSVCDETGSVRQHVNLFVNEQFLHEREGLDTLLQSGDILTIMPAVSGG